MEVADSQYADLRDRPNYMAVLHLNDKLLEQQLSPDNQRSLAAANSWKLLAVRYYQHMLGPAIDSTILMPNALGRSVQRRFVFIYHRTAKPHVYAVIVAQYEADPKYSQDIDRDMGEITCRIRLVAAPNAPARQ